MSTQIITTTLRPLTSDSRREVFILDDSAFERPNANKVELAAKLYDQAAHRYTKGFRFLQLGWSDGNTFLPVMSASLSSENTRNELQPVKGPLDKRSLSSQRKLQSQRKGTDVAIVATQYMLLAIQNRKQVDDCSLGELFYLDVQ